jgi:Na+-driven multidrug efflux pump
MLCYASDWQCQHVNVTSGITEALLCTKVSLPLMLCCQGCTLCAVLRPDAAVYALAVPHLQMKALACPAAVLMFVAVGAFRGFKDTT